MRNAITVGTLHAGGFEVIFTPSTPIDRQYSSMKGYTVAREHPKYCRVALWTSDRGEVKYAKLDKPKPKTETLTEAPKQTQPEPERAKRKQ